MKTVIALITTVLAVSAGQANAEGIPIEPGMWESKTTINMPMFPQPQVSTDRECITRDELTLDDVRDDDPGTDCQWTVEKVDGNTMKWSADCTVEGGARSQGEWSITASGDSYTGGGKMTMTVQDRAMEMTMEMEGLRVGDCE